MVYSDNYSHSHSHSLSIPSCLSLMLLFIQPRYSVATIPFNSQCDVWVVFYVSNGSCCLILWHGVIFSEPVLSIEGPNVVLFPTTAPDTRLFLMLVLLLMNNTHHQMILLSYWIKRPASCSSGVWTVWSSQPPLDVLLNGSWCARTVTCTVLYPMCRQ